METIPELINERRARILKRRIASDEKE